MRKQVISFHYTVKDKSGAAIDSSVGGEPMAFLQGSGQIIPGLEATLNSLKKGEKKEIDVPAEKAYGAFNEKLITRVPRNKFPEKVKEGDIFEVSRDNIPQLVTVVNISDTDVTLDANHPLAGQDLHFSIEITDIRDATAEEVTHGHAHGAGGHSHGH